MAAVGERSVKWRTGGGEALERPPQGELFKYRLVRADGRDAGRAAYQADIRPGDIVADYRGQWLRVLKRAVIDDADSVYDSVLTVEPA
jgi:hypothetical protein